MALAAQRHLDLERPPLALEPQGDLRPRRRGVERAGASREPDEARLRCYTFIHWLKSECTAYDLRSKKFRKQAVAEDAVSPPDEPIESELQAL